MRSKLVLMKLPSLMKLARRLHDVGYRAGSGEKVEVHGRMREKYNEKEEVVTRITEAEQVNRIRKTCAVREREDP